MTCTPRRPCGPGEPGLGLVPPPPEQARLERRVGDFHAFLADVVARTERTRPVPGGPALGRDWDVEGDPRARMLARLWAYVAESVAAYSELTAGEAYLGTAADWTDLRRLAALVGYKPRPRVAAQGWVRFDTDKGAAPVVPAGIRVQAPATPERESQTYEVIEETALRADWAGLTATPVPEVVVPTGRELRLMGEQDFRNGDRVLLLHEQASAAPPFPLVTWWDFWGWFIYLWQAYYAPASTQTPRGVAVVEDRRSELGTTVLTFDRELDKLLPASDKPYAAYRVLGSAGSARTLRKVVSVVGGTATPVTIANFPVDAAFGPTFLVLDAALDDVSVGQQVAVVHWKQGKCDVARVEKHELIEWEVAPGTHARVSKLHFAAEINTLKEKDGPFTAYVLDRRVVAQHYVFPETVTGPAQLRLYPAPEETPERVAVKVGETWEVFETSAAAVQESVPPATSIGPAPRGLTVDLDRTPVGTVDRAPASANLVLVHHGTTTSGAIGSGAASTSAQRFRLPKAPVAYDLAPDGSPVPSLELRVEGVRWEERPSLYGAGAAEVFAVELSEDGGVTVAFDQSLPTGRGNVTASYRIGGGVAGEVPSGAIDALVGSIRGVKGVGGAGPTTGGADQDDPARLRALAPTRARAFGRVVSRGDLVDLSLGYPGVSHAAAWNGAGPPGCACGGTGLHLAFVRSSSTGPKPPLGSEVAALSGYLDGRRDVEVPLCVCAGTVTDVTVTGTVAADPRREKPVVLDAVRTAILDPGAPIAPDRRLLGQPLDRSDVLAVIHGVVGVVGVPSLTISGIPATDTVGRRPAELYELLRVTIGAIT